MENTCDQVERLKEVERALAAGEFRFLSIDTKQDKILAEAKITNQSVAKMYNRMFIDNGSPSFQTRLDRHDTVMKFVVKSVAIVATGLIGLAATLLVQILI